MSSSARYKCHGPINQEYSLRDHEPHHRNFRPQQIEESDNDINREDLITLPKPEIDLVKNKPHVRTRLYIPEQIRNNDDYFRRSLESSFALLSRNALRTIG